MNPREKIPKKLPCRTCLVVVMCLGESLSKLFETCPILQEWLNEQAL